MAGKNSVRIPVALELESEDIIKDYKATINKMSNIDDLQSQFKELLKLQKQYIDKANASADPMTKALNLQGVKAYSEMLSRVQSQVSKIDKTKLSDFTLPKLQFDDKEILNSVNNIDKAVKGVLRDMENIGKSTGLGNLFKGIGSDSIKKFYQERIESSSDAVKYELKNNRLSIESIEKLLDTMQQYEIFNKKILKKSGTISTNVEDVLPKNLLKNENLFKNISLDELQVRWKKITTPDVVDNVRSAIIGNLSSRAMNKPLYIPTDGLIMNSEVANDFGAYQKKIDAAKLSLKEIGKEFTQLNENVDPAELSFKTKDGKDDIEQMNKYLDMAFKIKSAIQDVKSLSSAIGIGEKDSLKLSDFGLARFDTVFDDIMGKPNTRVISEYFNQVEESITRSFNKAMGDVGDDSEKVLRTKLSQINQIITDGTKLSYINESNLSEELDATLGKENSLNLVLIQRQKIMSELVKKGYQLSEKELQANSATIQAEQIRKGYMPVFGPNGNVGSGSGDGNSNYSNDEVANLKKEYADITVEVEKYKQQITELTAKLQEYRTVSNQPDNFKAKLLATEQALEAAQQKITELNQKISDWKDRVEQEAIINSSGYTVHQSDYDALVSTLEKVKAEAQNTKDELEQLKATSVQLGEGEQVVKGGDSGTIKELGEAVKALQARMNKAEEILKDVPEGMNGLKQLSGQIGKMSGNFNEDGSLKNLGKTSEELSEQFKALETKFEERLNQKIAEIEKKSYKEKSPNRKFNLVGSLKDLKVVVKSQNDTLTSATDTAQKNTAIKTEETTQELYKETEAYKTLADAVEKYNTLTAQHLGENDFDARIKRLQDMQACVEKIIAGVENYEGKANELSALTLQSKKGNISIQDSTKLDTLMSKLQAGVDKNVDKKNQFAQLEEEAKKFEAAVNEYDQKFQSIISQKVTSSKQFSAMKRSLQDMSNSLDAIMEKYDTFKGQDFYSSDFADRGEAIRGKVKDASLDLNEISKYKGFEEEILTIQAKYSESLKRQKQEQDTVVEAARKKAEAEKQASEAAKSNETGIPANMLVAEKSREEQKRKALERQAAQQAAQTSSSPSNFAGQSQQEIDAVNAIDKTVQALTEHIQNKTTAIKTEATTMSEAAQSEVGSVEKISSAVTDLNNKITSVTRINISDNASLTNPITVSATIGEAQIAAIREKIVAAFNENNPVPISFVPKIEGIREQITKAIGKAPIELKSSKTTNIFKIEKLTVSKKVVNELKNSIAEKLDSVQVKSFDVKSAAEKIKTDLGELLSDVKLRFDTSELESDIKEAMDNAAAQREVKEPDEKQKDEPNPTQKAAYTRAKNDIEKITADAKKASEQIAQYLPENLKRELTNTVNVLSDMKPLANLDDAGAMSEWVAQSRVIADNWKTLNNKIQGDLKSSGHMADVFVNSMSNVKYASEMNKDLDTTENKFKETFKGDQLEAFNAQLAKIREQLKAINSGETAYNIGNVQSVIDDMSALNNMTDRFTTVNNAKTDIDKMINKLNTAQNAVRGRGTQGQQFTNEITALMNQVKALETERNRLATGTDEDISAFILKVEDAGKSVDDLKRRASDFKIGDNAAASADKLKAKFDDLIYKAQDFKSKNSKMNRDSGLVAQYNEIIRLAQTAERTTKNFNEINAKFNALKATVMSKGLTGRSLGDELGYIASKIGLKAMLGGSVYRVLGYFRQMVTVVKELDTGMTTLKRVTSATSQEYVKFLKDASESAHEIGSTIKDVVDATGEFSKLGYSLSEATKLGQAATTYANVGFMDTANAIESMSSVIQGFRINANDAMSVVDKMNQIGNSYAISSEGVGEALKRSASSLVAAGNTLDESIALVTAGNTVLQDPESVANGIKVIGMRIRGKLCCHHIKKLICSHAKSEMITI